MEIDQNVTRKKLLKASNFNIPCYVLTKNPLSSHFLDVRFLLAGVMSICLSSSTHCSSSNSNNLTPTKEFNTDN